SFAGYLRLGTIYFPGPLGIVLCVIELMMVCVFWTVNLRVDGSDFTKAYATTLMVPLSGSTVTKFWNVVNSIAGVHYDYTAYGQISYFIQNLYGTLVTATELYVMMGTVELILLLVVTALQQKRLDDIDSTRLGFITILLVAMTLGSLNYFVDPPYRGIPKFLTTLVVICASAALVVLLLTERKAKKSTSPAPLILAPPLPPSPPQLTYAPVAPFAKLRNPENGSA
ncbi:hypothetical protein GCK32_005814, partial [Trichostrongylus colubriformis]